MNSKHYCLPGYCLLIDEMIAEIAEEQGREPKEIKERVLMNIRDTQS